MNRRTVILLLSDFERSLPHDGEWPRLPALQRLLSKGERERLPADYFSSLTELLPLSQIVSPELPVAPLSAHGDGLEVSDGWWLHADPVHMVADRDQLYLSASEILEVTQSEADSVVAELNHLYQDEGWKFAAPSPQRWYLRLPQALAMHTIPTQAAMGRPVGEVLPQGDDALYWQRVMTEIQMVLHTSPINDRRSEAGLLELNSLWFWGGGELPQADFQPGFSRVVADDPLVKGLARLHGLLVESADTASMEVASGEKILWQARMESLGSSEQVLFAPLLNMLQTGKLDEVVIMLPELGRWRIERPALRRWWRRIKPLASLLKEEG
ncbi:MAG: hypothetical protein R6X15_04520 [Pseudomonadota bacterium]